MTIEFRCSCGALCRADESQVGQLVQCEACGLDVPVPSRYAAERVVEDDAPEAEAPPPEPASDEGEPAQGDAPAGDDASASDGEESRTAAEALREQLGGGGAADIAAHIHDGADQSARVEAAAEAEKHREDADALREQLGGDAEAAAEKRRGDADALREQLGGGGIADIADALREEGADAGGQAAAGAPALGAADLAAAGPGRTEPKKKVLRGHERAAHHITFKKAIWLPALLVGLFCLAVGAYCFIPQPDPTYEQHMARFEEELRKGHIPVDGYEIVWHGGEAWAIPEGAEHRKTNTGRVYYSNPAGFDEPAVHAEDYAKSRAAEEGRMSGYFLYGVLLVVVGLVLIVLSVFTYRDVRLVRAAQAEGGAEPQEAEEVPVAAEVAPEPEEESPEEAESPGEDEAPADEPPESVHEDADTDEDMPGGGSGA
ncbi:MAG: hypothetical protein R6X20_17085 [Phycisphaerae bacterium]